MIWLSSLGWDVTAVDFSQAALDKGLTLAGDLGVDWVCADATAWTGDDLDLGFIDEFHRHRCVPVGSRANEKPRARRGLRSPAIARRDQAVLTLTVRRFSAPFTPNSTVPSASAKRVWSRPRPTFLPG